VIKYLLTLSLCLIAPRAATGEYVENILNDTAIAGHGTSLKTEKGTNSSFFGVRGHEPSSVSWVRRIGSSADLDESLRIKLSFRYDFKELPFWRKTINEKIFFTYTGVFDFYVLCGGCRESEPVVGRVYNPALHWRFLETNDTHLQFSIQHRSNGQVTDARLTDASGNFIADTEFQNMNIPYIDGISRSSNFIELEYKKILNNNDRVYLRIRPFFDSRDSLQTWRVSEPRDADYEDYDRVQLIYSKVFSCDSRFSVKWSVGDSGFSTDSLDLGFQYNWRGLPLYLSAHHGPMETLSDHTRNVTSIGLGIVFWNICLGSP